jgi:hypothetical protein
LPRVFKHGAILVVIAILAAKLVRPMFIKKQYRLYLPILYESSSRGNNPTVTFTSTQIFSNVKEATKIRVVVTTSPAYGASFFVKSPQGANTIIDEEIDLGGSSTVVFYLSRVEVAVGVNP